MGDRKNYGVLLLLLPGVICCVIALYVVITVMIGCVTEGRITKDFDSLVLFFLVCAFIGVGKASAKGALRKGAYLIVLIPLIYVILRADIIFKGW